MNWYALIWLWLGMLFGVFYGAPTWMQLTAAFLLGVAAQIFKPKRS